MNTANMYRYVYIIIKDTNLFISSFMQMNKLLRFKKVLYENISINSAIYNIKFAMILSRLSPKHQNNVI